MKSFVGALLLVSSLGFSQQKTAATYVGNGQMTGPDGVVSTYSVTVHKDCNQDGTKTVRTTVDTANQHMEWSMVAHPTKIANRYDLTDAQQENIGFAYCNVMPSAKVCHMEVTQNGTHVEKTIHVTAKIAHTMGSVTADGKVYTWADALKNANAKSDAEALADLF